MSGDPILHEILGRGEGFGHRQHVELTWRYLEDHDPAGAQLLVAEAIRQLAAAHGVLQKFHATITGAWVRCVAVHRERWPPTRPGRDRLNARVGQSLRGGLEEQRRWVSCATRGSVVCGARMSA